jgi:hypothetical protein
MEERRVRWIRVVMVGETKVYEKEVCLQIPSQDSSRIVEIDFEYSCLTRIIDCGYIVAAMTSFGSLVQSISAQARHNLPRYRTSSNTSSASGKSTNDD